MRGERLLLLCMFRQSVHAYENFLWFCISQNVPSAFRCGSNRVIVVIKRLRETLYLGRSSNAYDERESSRVPTSDDVTIFHFSLFCMFENFSSSILIRFVKIYRVKSLGNQK